jgi:hypothetical protein
MRRLSGLIILLALALAACKNDTKKPENPTNQTTVPPNATLSPVYVHLQRDYESLDAAHQAIAAVWEGLADGQQVQCGEYPDVLKPESVSAAGETDLEPLADSLRQAAIDITESVELWKAECANPRANPSPDVISQGVLKVRAAGDLLKKAAGLLSGIQAAPQQNVIPHGAGVSV